MGSSSKESEHCGSGLDRISLLPDDVIDKILTILPIVEAAKTAVLSKYWKRGWRNISELKFDSSFGEKFENAGHPNLMLAICRILFLHSGSIDGFSLSIPWLESCAEINPLIQFLSDKKVKHLNIFLCNKDEHVLPSYLFSCFQLSTLDLVGCVLNLPRNFGGFSELITLDLCQVIVTNDFGIFISNCPLLQQTLDVCNLSEESPKRLLQLKDLTVRRVLFDDITVVSSLAGLIRSSPNIERLKIYVHNHAAGINHGEKYGFSCNRLQTVELYNFCGTNAEMMFVKALLLKSPQLKEMTIRGVDKEKELQILRGMIGFRRASVNVVIKLYLKKNIILRTMVSRLKIN